ncbi:hypothetical protein PtA15_6A625 [Puccinia triticina]|uniref:Translation initiation factor eIF2B subunit gamma n=1 Tax=Puccinia triticina TaxID=208348 RepID=A0ABY7CMQ9_9BASI|nr:uncharacterized protein PtA15_6A625 [Puccinia triticina]WAQ85995.1 hypothetical protein PtA15_6A625 [Puccinia triticina]WAR55894.1 hypothetical protein PtB15_6B638 [Puccinia triticina]
MTTRRPGLPARTSAASLHPRPTTTAPAPGQPPNATSYVAVVLAGPGEGLFPLVNTLPTAGGEEPGLAKAALPVLNRPMVDFVLDWVADSGLSDVLLLAAEGQRACLAAATRTRKPALAVRLECIPDSDAAGLGTADTLRWAIQRGLITTAFVLLPCDLYFQLRPPAASPMCAQTEPIYDRSLLSIVERHRTSQVLLTTVFYERQANTLDVRDGPGLALVTLDPRSGVLLNLQELDGFGAQMLVRMALVDRFPTAVLSSSLVPAHVFVCSPAVIDLLQGLPQLASFKHQFVPWLAKNQWQPGLLKKTALASTKLDGPLDPLTAALQRSSTNPTPQDWKTGGKRGERTPLTAASTPPISRTFSCLSLDGRADPLSHGALSAALASPAPNAAGFRCDYVLWRACDGFVCRANSVPAYAEINRTALKLEHERLQTLAPRPSGPPPPGTGTAGADSLVAPGASLLDKASVKKSVVGRGCVVGRAAKVVNSVLMDRVSIGEHAKIENCVLATAVVIGDRVELKDCEVESGTVIEADFVTKGEKIARS